uniref:Peptidase S1 domain-containing protein n=1 Tax=Anopheles epiroticus TaxID=199890 RepID=A0A182PAJ8_9DIPT
MLPTSDNVRWITQIAFAAILIGSAATASNEGEPCAYGNDPGICQGYNLCRPLLEKSRIVKICGYTPQQAIVCCPIDFRQRLAELSQTNQRIKCREYQSASSSGIVKHPNYKPRTVYNDIALLKLAHPVSFSSRVRPACLYNAPEVDRTKAVAIGFGSTEACEFRFPTNGNTYSFYSVPGITLTQTLKA